MVDPKRIPQSHYVLLLECLQGETCVSLREHGVASGGETLMNIDCIETRDGWRFDYEGVPDDASEGMSVLQKSM